MRLLFLLSGGGGTCVDDLRVVDLDGLDKALLAELSEGSTGQGTIDLKTFHEGGRSDELALGDFGQEAVVVCLLVKKDLVGHLLTHLSLAPLLLVSLKNVCVYVCL